MVSSPSLDPADFQAFFESAPNLYLVLRPDGTIVAASNAYLRATMQTREAILGRNCFEVFPDNPADPEATGERNVRESIRRAVKNRKADTMAIQKYDVQKPDGGGFEVRYWSPIHMPVLGPDNEVRYIIHRVEDVTAFVKLQRSLKATTDKKGGGEIKVDPLALEVYLRAQEVHEAQRSLELEHTQLEQELWQAQKMEVIGQLTGGMAHDFNNMLGIIMGNLELMEGKTLSDAEEYRLSAIQAINRGAELVKALLAFSRQQPLNPTVVDVNEQVSKLIRLLRRVIGEEIEITIRTASDLGTVRVDSVQLESVITNLAVNARDAMPKGGKLTISTHNVVFDDDFARQNMDVRPGPYVAIEITDTGVGMPDDVLARAFEPFFTTKEIGKGTGLGLAMVYGFIKQSHGHIKISSEVGHGTSVKLFLPLHRDGKARPVIKELPAAMTSKRGETIFVVEDNDDVRRMTVKQLHDLGYKTLEAANGKEAQDIIDDGQSFDLLFSDIIMPGEISGFELARHALERYPYLPILFTSGFPGATVEEQREIMPGRTFDLLSKPYRKSDLGHKIRETLDKRH
jgi:signal transduction histidine kinase/CheY-like chemotaxis protein